VNRPNNESDEDVILEDGQTNRFFSSHLFTHWQLALHIVSLSFLPSRRWSVRNNTIQFPLLANGPRLKLSYRRSFGQPSLILLVLFLDHQEYLDRFVHIYDSVIRDNQYAISAIHHSNQTLTEDSAILNRFGLELATGICISLLFSQLFRGAAVVPTCQLHSQLGRRHLGPFAGICRPRGQPIGRNQLAN
jgi:hypothetical protein